ncbi:hypothetical protein CTB96_10015 [Cryobacterium arcticum]|uniref:MmcQ/YjbR family DNA-binding protein n=2 Tax=Cryobacterium arcticum TaxID=670052 RepID=A0A317ZX77_9MICO|nr:hypothetical protein CTB96_10015 [Cryobacterium arcticum]
MSVDQDNDVLVTSDGLRARGRLFAFMDGNDLVVALPEARARDLIQRAVGYEFEATGHPGRAWVRIRDRQLWSELAREAHEYVGEPPVGGDS